MPEYTIYLGADHRGFAKKNELLKILAECHPGMLKVEDLGAHEYDPEDDYNDPAIAVSKAVMENPHSFGLLLCGSAHGVTMQTNRFKGIRAANADTVASAEHARVNDHANILCLSADYLEIDQMEPIVKAFCHARPSSEEKYLRRVRKLDENGA